MISDSRYGCNMDEKSACVKAAFTEWHNPLSLLLWKVHLFNNSLYFKVSQKAVCRCWLL